MLREHNLHASVFGGFTSSPFFYERFYKIQKTRKRKKNYCSMSINLDLFLSQFVLSNHRVALLCTFLLTGCFQNCLKMLVTFRKIVNDLVPPISRKILCPEFGVFTFNI